MRVVIQRVTRAAVRVAGETVGAIEQPGYLVLVGITHGDGAAQIAKLADKTANLRLLEGEKSLLDEGAPRLAGHGDPHRAPRETKHRQVHTQQLPD